MYTARHKSNKSQEELILPNLKQIIDSHPKLNLNTTNSNNFLNDESADSNSAIGGMNTNYITTFIANVDTF